MKQVKNSGFALLAVLVFVVLLSILVTSFMLFMQIDRVSTQNYSDGAKAQELAQGALQEIMGDLLMEIDAGSLQDGTPAGAQYTDQGIRVYVPSSTRAMLPARIGFADEDFANDISPTKLPPSVIRVSRASASFLDPATPPAGYISGKLPPNRASSAPTSSKSANGRWITAKRWNKPLLMGLTTPSVFYSADGDSNNDKVPDWVYVTRSGSRVCEDADVDHLKQSTDLSDSDQILGRYAFVVYEQGGLLDLNSAGYPSSALAQTADAQAVAGKSYLAYADLSQLQLSTNPSANKSAIDKIINWRNRGGLVQSGGNYVSLVTKAAKKGFLKFEADDSPLLGRQDLIRYLEFLKENGYITDLKAASYLGTFNRALTAPTWAPFYNASGMANPQGSINYNGTAIPSGDDGAGGVYKYKDNAELSSSINRDIANTRLPEAVAVPHYLDDGTLMSSPPVALAGGPLLKTRFSLARLSWLTPTGPANGVSPLAIQSCFGLTWNAANARWEYFGSTGTTPVTSVKTLDMVAVEDPKREPNFFELLKAGILSGSLGVDPGAVCGSGTSVTPAPIGNGEGPSGRGFEMYSASKDKQVIQIGANIIDQYDADSYPTALHFKIAPDPSASTPEQEPVNLYFGIENLPYLTQVDEIFIGWGGAERHWI